MPLRAAPRLRALAAVVLSGGLLATAGPAAAAAQEGTWWYSAMGVAEVNAAGADGSGVTVAVIDDAINTELPMFAGADVEPREPSYCTSSRDGSQLPAARTDIAQSHHGSNVSAFVVGQGAGSVAGVAPRARLLFYSVGREENLCVTTNSSVEGAPPPMALAIRQAVDDGAQIISTSLGGANRQSAQVQEALAWALNQDVVVVASLSQDDPADDGKLATGDDLSAANGVVAVEACDRDLEVQKDREGRPVPHDRVTVCAPGVGLMTQGDPATGDWSTPVLGSGTSYATPIVAGALAAVWSRYPDATGAQMLQTLVHDTGSEEHELGYDDVYGYGLVGLRHMLREDPTRFPDENPLVVDIGTGAEADRTNLTVPEIESATRPVWPGDEPTAEPTSADEEPAATSAPAPEAGAPPTDPAAGPSPAVWLAAGGALLALLVVVGMLLARRRAAAAGGDIPPAGPHPPAA